MWNSQYRKFPLAYTGLKDLVAVWRLLYDDKFLYLSCEFFDDRHVEGTDNIACLNRLHVKLVSVVQLGLRGRSRQGYEPAGKSKTRIIAEEHVKAH
jgi:S-adenosylmethionine/arginine decarboxylase-like enzyme